MDSKLNAYVVYEASQTQMGGTVRQKLNHQSVTGLTTRERLPGTFAPGLDIDGRSFGASSPDFARNRVGMPGPGLTSGLKVSRPTAINRQEASARHE